MGAKVSGNLSFSDGPNQFDFASGGLVPSGDFGNAPPNLPINIAVNDSQVEFASGSTAGLFRDFADLTTEGIITFREGIVNGTFSVSDHTYTLTSSAFAGLTYVSISSTYPATANLTASLQGNTLKVEVGGYESQAVSKLLEFKLRLQVRCGTMIKPHAEIPGLCLSTLV